MEEQSLVKKIIYHPAPYFVLIFILIILYSEGVFDARPVLQDKVKLADHSGSIETFVSVSHLNDKSDILTTTHKVWAAGFLANTFVTNDTIPALGLIYTQAEDSDGHTQNVTVPREYELYITVK